MIINSRVCKKKNDLKLLMMVNILFVVNVCNICLSFFFCFDKNIGSVYFLFRIFGCEKIFCWFHV